jgi:AraC-like DNA-binding protein
MIHQYKHPGISASFILSDDMDMEEAFQYANRHLKFIWNRDSRDLEIEVDGIKLILKANQLLCCTYNQDISIPKQTNKITLLFFNREFYCIHTYDREVSCNGLLFFGSDYTPILQLDQEEIESLGTLIEVLRKEFKISDNNQEEMLRILLKRFIIRATRLARKQLLKENSKTEEVDIVRQFNSLVEEHFKGKKTVGDYAELMHKSPKTIANIFTKVSKLSPLQVIHERIVVEAKRLLIYTENPIKSIGYELGYEDYAQFSKFFKKMTGMYPQEFRAKNPSLSQKA